MAMPYEHEYRDLHHLIDGVCDCPCRKCCVFDYVENTGECICPDCIACNAKPIPNSPDNYEVVSYVHF